MITEHLFYCDSCGIMATFSDPTDKIWLSLKPTCICKNPMVPTGYLEIVEGSPSKDLPAPKLIT